MLGRNENGYILPIEYRKGLFVDLVKSLPGPLKYYFEHDYGKRYIMTSRIDKPKIFKENDINFVNSFPGFKYAHDQHLKEVHEKQQETIKFISDHLKNVLCSGNEEVYKITRALICETMKGKHTGI